MGEQPVESKNSKIFGAFEIMRCAALQLLWPQWLPACIPLIEVGFQGLPKAFSSSGPVGDQGGLGLNKDYHGSIGNSPHDKILDTYLEDKIPYEEIILPACSATDIADSITLQEMRAV